MLVERIGRDRNFDPLATSGDHRERRQSGIGDPHVVLELGHVFLGRGLFRERPGQHELGLENRPAARDHAVDGGPHPPEHRMSKPVLNAFNGLSGIALVPIPVEGFGHGVL